MAGPSPAIFLRGSMAKSKSLFSANDRFKRCRDDLGLYFQNTKILMSGIDFKTSGKLFILSAIIPVTT